MSKKFDENGIAEAIVSVLPAGVVREFSSERDTIRYAVRGEGIKLRKIVLNRKSLRRLAEDAAGTIKIEYLQRDLLAAAGERREFRYPRPVVHVSADPLRVALPLVSAR
ncbi:MAG TPA: hypothetical protein VF846_22075 [Thermoanaerobaculia bacterium]